MKELENEDAILIARIKDQKRLCDSKNKIINTVFLNSKELVLARKNIDLSNSFEYGVNDNAERKVIIFYPEKLTEELARKNLKLIVSCIRIELPNENIGKFEHKNYLSALMKIGLERERIGDIIVYEKGADIIILKSNIEYTINSLKQLTRFRKAQINEIDLDNIHEKVDTFEEKQIIVPSMRIDSFVSELAKCSRNSAIEYIENERVLINYETVLKPSKTVQIEDIITIRGKGKFIVSEYLRNTKNGNMVIRIKKYS